MCTQLYSYNSLLCLWAQKLEYLNTPSTYIIPRQVNMKKLLNSAKMLLLKNILGKKMVVILAEAVTSIYLFILLE